MARPPRALDSRRRFLGTLAVAPLVPLAAGCATAAPAKPPPAVTSGAPAEAAAAAAEAPADPYRALRDQPVPGDAEPALAFRPLLPRGGAR